MKKYADLHLHTNFSDGSFSPDEVLSRAKKAGLSCIAISDHDCIDILKMSDQLQKTYGIEIIPAVEITAQENGKELHILGYCIEWRSEKLSKILSGIRENRLERLYQIVVKLKELGINADAEEIIKYCKGVAISRLHIARYLVEKGLVLSMKTVFDEYLGDGKPCCVNRFQFSPKEVVDIIRDAGGAAVIAHPGLNNVVEVMPSLLKSGIDGIEVFHSDHTRSTSASLLKLAEENNLLVTGGSDCHGLHKRKILIGKIKLPYEYVERLKIYVQGRRAGKKGDSKDAS